MPELQKQSDLTDKNETYKWIIAAVSFLMVATSLGFCSGNKSLYLKAMTEALGIERRFFFHR